jgi:hypothetical protein
MMLRLYILQSQWIIWAMLAGLAMVIFMVLAYVAIWKQRHGSFDETAASANQQPSTLLWLRAFLPWALVVTVLTAAVFSIAYIAFYSVNPPNW